jgi:DNA-binding response OmpR family regulator
MPKIDSFYLYYEIKKIDDNVKIFFLIASETYYEESRIKQYCALDIYYIRKPISIYDLTNRLKEELNENDKWPFIKSMVNPRDSNCSTNHVSC